VWWSGPWRAAADPALNVAAELEALGYGALWSSGGFDAGLSPIFGQLLSSTTKIAVASGIVSMWTATPADIGPAVADLAERFPGRFLLGIGASHAALVSDYTHPYSHMVAYLDALDSLKDPVRAEHRVLAALGPRMLELSAQRAAGAHPYFVPAAHTAHARSVLGPGPLLAPEVAVVLETDPTAARSLAREYASLYLGLIDSVIPWGDAAALADRIGEHYDAGADHVCVQVISAAGRDGFPLVEYTELAGEFIAG
jgi:probable F420-dependent oxidoreductase